VVIGQRVLPAVLERTGYGFEHTTAEQALRWATA
jgi:NAD dependent epimerase/dehydratase family enzyme